VHRPVPSGGNLVPAPFEFICQLMYEIEFVSVPLN
jgi:hypothetical protein